jgi:hypothetical protein
MTLSFYLDFWFSLVCLIWKLFALFRWLGNAAVFKSFFNILNVNSSSKLSVNPKNIHVSVFLKILKLLLNTGQVHTNKALGYEKYLVSPPSLDLFKYFPVKLTICAQIMYVCYMISSKTPKIVWCSYAI